MFDQNATSLQRRPVFRTESQVQLKRVEETMYGHYTMLQNLISGKTLRSLSDPPMSVSSCLSTCVRACVLR